MNPNLQVNGPNEAPMIETSQYTQEFECRWRGEPSNEGTTANGLRRMALT